MARVTKPSSSSDEGKTRYQIKVAGHLDRHWEDWLGGLQITYDAQGNSLLTGVIPDQSALHGILLHIRNLGMKLVSLIPQPDQFDEMEANENWSDKDEK